MESPIVALKSKRDQWNNDEIKSLLEIIKEKHISELLDNKTKRNKVIYTEIEEKLQKRNIYKTSDQIRNKFKYLKCDYHKIKRNKTKSAARQTSAHFEILDEIFSHRPSLTAKEDFTIEKPTHIIAAKEIRSNQETVVKTRTETPEEGPSSCRTHISKKAAKRSSYEKVVESFTSQWQKTHEEILKKMMERDEKNWERLEENRRETERILEKDRQETAQILRSLVQFASNPRTQRGIYDSELPASPQSNSAMSSPMHNSSIQPLLNSSPPSPPTAPNFNQ